MHTLSNAGLIHYLADRFNSSPYPFRTEFTPEGDGLILVSTVSRYRRSITLKPRLTKGRKEVLEIAIDADIPDIQHADAARFLSSLIDNDAVFHPNGALYSPEREQDLQRLRSILKRCDYSKKGLGLACEVVNPGVNNETIKKATMDYMVRPTLVLLFRIR